MNDIKKELRKYAMPEILPRLKWERNSIVKRNQNIKSHAIIEKSSTDQFPEDSVTIRINSIKRKVFSAYFNGKKKGNSYKDYNGNVVNYHFIEEKLKVTVNCDSSKVSILGDLPDSFDFHHVAIVCDYVKEELFQDLD